MTEICWLHLCKNGSEFLTKLGLGFSGVGSLRTPSMSVLEASCALPSNLLPFDHLLAVFNINCLQKCRYNSLVITIELLKPQKGQHQNKGKSSPWSPVEYSCFLKPQ